MGNDIVNTYSDGLFELYNRANDLCRKGSQNGWPFCETETGLRVFQAAAAPHIGGTAPSATSSASPAPPPRPQTRPIWLQTAWPVGVGALVVVCCVLALAWEAHRQALAKVRLQKQDLEVVNTWREVGQQLVHSLTAELRVLNSNQTAFATSQAQIGAGLAEIGNTEMKLVALASTQASATRDLATAQTESAQEATNLVASLRQTFQQELAEAARQSHADTANLASTQASATRDLAATQSALAQATTNLVASLRQTFQQGIAKTASQSRADIAKLQTQIAEMAASHRALLERLSGPTNAPNLDLALPGVRTKTIGNSILITFDDGLFLHGACFKPDAKCRLQALAKALAQVSTPLRIEVIGCADDDRVFRGWTARFEESLALDRATAVVNYFIELGLFAPTRLAALSGDAANRPFPSDTDQNRARNRTVMLRVSTEAKPLAGQDEPAP